jgi:molecular chaperone GrpE
MSAKKRKTEENKQVTGEEMAGEQPVSETMAEVAIPAEEINQLRSERDQAEARANEYLDGWQRERAEFFNYKKRMERELSQGGQNALGNAIRRYLDIADDLARALKTDNRPSEGNGAIWAEGIDLIHRKLIAAFEADGVRMIDTKNSFFDPNLHEAISNEDSPDHESGQIIDIVQPGYMLGERVIRPARVRVAR